jgi:hypothetical protein
MRATKSSRNLSFVLAWLLASQLMQAAWAAQPTVQALSKDRYFRHSLELEGEEPLLLSPPLEKTPYWPYSLY